jgi:hypothetical protein
MLKRGQEVLMKNQIYLAVFSALAAFSGAAVPEQIICNGGVHILPHQPTKFVFAIDEKNKTLSYGIFDDMENRLEYGSNEGIFLHSKSLSIVEEKDVLTISASASSHMHSRAWPPPSGIEWPQRGLGIIHESLVATLQLTEEGKHVLKSFKVNGFEKIRLAGYFACDY